MRALDAELSTRNIVYKSPQSGDNRSAFIFFDMDGDAVDEAVVFYSYMGDETGATYAKVLTQRPDGEWQPLYDIASQSANVEFVRFEKMLDTNSHCMLIGWAGTGTGASTLQVASLRGGVFKDDEFSAPYLGYAVDAAANGLAAVVLVSRSAGGRLSLNLVSGLNGYIESSNTLPLASDAEELLRVTGPYDGKIYIDELLGGRQMNVATEIVQIIGQRMLAVLCGGDAAEGVPRTTVRENYEQTVRNEELLCDDYNGDGVIDVPLPVPLPGSGENTAATPSLVRFMQFTNGSFEFEGAAVINSESGYLIYFPDRWIDTVTVERSSEVSEWRFRKWNADLQESADELLRVRVSSSQDYLDMYEDYSVELASKAALTYSAYIPELREEPLAVSAGELGQMFRLL